MRIHYAKGFVHVFGTTDLKRLQVFLNTPESMYSVQSHVDVNVGRSIQEPTRGCITRSVTNPDTDFDQGNY